MGGSFPKLRQFFHTYTDQYSAKCLRGNTVYLFWILCIVLAFLMFLWTLAAFVFLDTILSPQLRESIRSIWVPFHWATAWYYLKIVTWGNHRTECFLVLKDCCPLWPDVQYFKKHCFTYFCPFILVVSGRVANLILVIPSYPYSMCFRKMDK